MSGLPTKGKNQKRNDLLSGAAIRRSWCCSPNLDRLHLIGDANTKR